MLVGYMRVSTDGDRQTFDLQRDALLAAGVDERCLFEDRVSGSRGERTGLAKALAFIKSGDCLVVWKLDRLGRSLPHLLGTVSDLRARGIVAFPEDLGVHPGQAQRSLLAARSVEDLVAWSGGLYEPPSRFRSW